MEINITKFSREVIAKFIITLGAKMKHIINVLNNDDLLVLLVCISIIPFIISLK